VPMRIFPNQVRNEDKSFDTRIVGTSADYARLHRLEMDAGRFFNDDDNPAGKADTEVVRNVIVLGNGVAKKLFPGEECKKIVGKNVIAYRHEFEVIGVAKAADAFDQDVYIPIAIVKLRFGERITIRKPGSFTAEIVELHQIDIVADPARVQALEKEIRAILEKHHVREDWEIVPR
jgi:putative ABC transport system permease protein